VNLPSVGFNQRLVQCREHPLVNFLNTANSGHLDQQSPLAIIVEEREGFGLINPKPTRYGSGAVIGALIQFSTATDANRLAAPGFRPTIRGLTFLASVSTAQSR
jgi:hypothetical protein